MRQFSLTISLNYSLLASCPYPSIAPGVRRHPFPQHTADPLSPTGPLEINMAGGFFREGDILLQIKQADHEVAVELAAREWDMSGRRPGHHAPIQFGEQDPGKTAITEYR